MLRVYICPVIGTGTKDDPFRSQVAAYGFQHSNYFPSKADGTPASPWVLSVVAGSDFTQIDADGLCDDLFAGNLPSSIQSRDDLLTFLRTHTIADVPVARRTQIQAVLDKYGVVRSDFTLTTPLWRVMRRVVSTLLEQDDNFASAF